MTTTARRPVTQRAAGHYTTRDHTVTGTPAQLANILANHRTAGTLVAMTPPQPVGDRMQMLIRIREYQPTPATRITSAGQTARTPARRPRRGTRIAVMVTATTATLGGLAAVVAYLLGQLVEFITAHAGLILGALVLAAILAIAAGRGTGRKHCPGC
jgi:hypothetical protein